MSLPDLDNISNSMLQLQTLITSNKTQTQWTNLTFSNCIKRYQEGTYESFSNVILISNWTSPSDSNNSALELTLLSGQTSPKHRVDQSLVSLCPESFFSKYDQTDPQEWKYVSSGANGLFDQYAPKKFPVKTENIFVHSCFSQEVSQRCRLLYSPLVLKIATACLMITVACLILSIFLGEDGEDLEIVPERVAFILGVGIIFVAFFVQFFLTAFGQVQREPRGRNDQAWLLNVFCIVNVVQLIDTICTDLFMSVHLNAMKYAPVSILWHVFLSGVFSMQLSDRYIFSNSSPGTTIFPITNLSSLWCKAMFKWLVKAEAYNPLPLPFVWIFTLVLFCLPFGLRLAAQQSFGKESG
ncbi:hypothetical protein N431DRAFT_456516 [Stipitochalara longipes BDJ]|nr:hypothetical protein N431DRAFT_456516 [Stipitochalara longipes BDJ]